MRVVEILTFSVAVSRFMSLVGVSASLFSDLGAVCRCYGIRLFYGTQRGMALSVFG